jgi:glycosyltransferase involved in cell wall biosynthesis
MMRAAVTIDARWLAGGIGTYTKQLLAGICQSPDGFEVRAITREKDAKLVSQWCQRVKVVNMATYTLGEQLAIPWAARGCDLLHIPHYNAPLLHRGPLLVSILDLIHITDPVYSNTFGSWVYARPMLNLVARKAQHIVTLSEYSKAQIVERLGVQPEKVTAIHCGVTPQFHWVGRDEATAAVSETLGTQKPYILYVGSLKPHKNVSTLLKAFAMLRKRHEIPQRLLIIGDDARWKLPLLEECVRLGIGDATHFVPYVSQELLPRVYAAAELLVMPSTIEGFGLPVLEAMASGTPVVCSRAASLPEVAGDAALYFDPASAEELADKIEKLLNSTGLQESLRAKGLERARQFTWEESTRKHLKVYQHLLGMN